MRAFSAPSLGRPSMPARRMPPGPRRALAPSPRLIPPARLPTCPWRPQDAQPRPQRFAGGSRGRAAEYPVLLRLSARHPSGCRGRAVAVRPAAAFATTRILQKARRAPTRTPHDGRGEAVVMTRCVSFGVQRWLRQGGSALLLHRPNGVQQWLAVDRSGGCRPSIRRTRGTAPSATSRSSIRQR